MFTNNGWQLNYGDWHTELIAQKLLCSAFILTEADCFNPHSDIMLPIVIYCAHTKAILMLTCPRCLDKITSKRDDLAKITQDKSHQ